MKPPNYPDPRVNNQENDTEVLFRNVIVLSYYINVLITLILFYPNELVGSWVLVTDF